MLGRFVRIDLDNRQIVELVHAHQLRGKHPPVVQRDAHLRRAVHHVVVGHDVSIRRNDHAAAHAMLNLGLRLHSLHARPTFVRRRTAGVPAAGPAG